MHPFQVSCRLQLSNSGWLPAAQHSVYLQVPNIGPMNAGFSGNFHVLCMSMQPAGTLLALGHSNGTVSIFDIASQVLFDSKAL